VPSISRSLTVNKNSSLISNTSKVYLRKLEPNSLTTLLDVTRPYAPSSEAPEVPCSTISISSPSSTAHTSYPAWSTSNPPTCPTWALTVYGTYGEKP
jgi:hypothetical protein